MQAIDDTHDYIFRSRIRSVRRRKRAQRKAFDKHLIHLHMEDEAIGREMQNLGWTELKPPIQRGFIRFFVLRDDVKRTKEAPFFEKLLLKINTKQWSARKDFKKKRKRYGKKVYAVREQSLRDIDECEFHGKKFNEQERLFFYEALTHSKYCKKPVKVYRFSEAWRFVLRVQPNMITKVRIKDFDLERRSDEISRYLSFNNRYYRLWRLLFGNKRWRYKAIPDEKYRDPLLNRSLADILSEYFPENPLIITHRNPRTPRVSAFISHIKHFTTTGLKNIFTYTCQDSALAS